MLKTKDIVKIAERIKMRHSYLLFLCLFSVEIVEGVEGKIEGLETTKRDFLMLYVRVCTVSLKYAFPSRT